MINITIKTAFLASDSVHQKRVPDENPATRRFKFQEEPTKRYHPSLK
jgi:hypothetical protein